MEVFEDIGNIWSVSYKEEMHRHSTNVQSTSDESSTSMGPVQISIVSSMLQHSRASGSQARAQKLSNPLIKRICQSLLPWQCEPQGSNQTWTLTLQLDASCRRGTPWLARNFSRVSWICVTMPLTRCETSWSWRSEVGKAERRTCKLTVRTALQKTKCPVRIWGSMVAEYPKKIQDKSCQPFFTNKEGYGRDWLRLFDYPWHCKSGMGEN